MAADERAKKYSVLTERLIAQFRNNGGLLSTLAPTTVLGFPNHLMVETVPGRRIEDLVLSKNTEQVVRNLVEEQHRTDLV